MKKTNSLENFRVVLVEPESSGNIGSIARLMKNFGLKHLVLVNPLAEVNEECVNFAAHGADIINNVKIVETLEKALEDTDLIIGTTSISASDYNPIRTCLSSYELYNLEFTQKNVVALVFGRESRGLSNEELNQCDFTVTIPAEPAYPTLNISHAASIIFYELYRIKAKKGFQKNRLASRVEKEAILKYFNEILREINYHVFKFHVATRIIRNIFTRALITGREAHTLIGILRRVSENLRKVEKK
ncbi:MAG: RNA methyltransferase [Candidatus Odinarchaeum yellowstonii]|uniref:RNA methyltransferase n=1 Tax=Odinarchaeota yellowstonii (strain LCB_4) TaxID=1841599 RepID=A0AAF0D0T0_ODILC|nr:MAG: RNA methyltransferase [Candidatus Odinarchaeum yellowstonii]